MEAKEAFEKITLLLPYIKEYHETKKLNIDFENRKVLKDVWERYVMPGSTAVITCYSCITFMFDVVQSFYEREYPLYLKSQLAIIKSETKESKAQNDTIIEKHLKTNKKINARRKESKKNG